MNKVDQGGPAFPNVPDGAGDRWANWDTGMSLRDYFAAQALQGFIASGRINTDRASSYYADSIAGNAYKLADAMIRERNKGV